MFRAKLAIGIVPVAMAVLFGLVNACSSNNPRDLNWGTDVAADFVPPDASAVDAQTEESGTSVDGMSNGQEDADISVDSMVDSDTEVDAPIDGAN